MSDIHYKTARKLMRQTPTTGYNPQSIIKESNLTFYNNSLGEKRKTQSKRYINANQSQFNNKTIDFSDFKSHRKTLSMGKQNQFHPLPQIKIAKNKRGAKKGSFLQIWLNEALDEGSNQAAQNHTVSANDQTLGALKSYGLDKKILKSKNISEETIDKIYKKLYVYTKGLGMTFEQVGRLASAKYPNTESQNSQNNGITEIFWKAFTKLLQNESPFETAFQVVQKGHLKAIHQLRQKMKTMRQEQQLDRKAHQQQIRKLQRQLQLLGTQYKHLQSDLNITKSTLQLTDKTLDQQINLRLKFQQKINSVYCSYQQIKTKYMALVQEMKIKRQISLQMELHQKSLKEQLENMTVTSQELQHLLQMQKAKNRDFLSELVIKSEQRSELQKQILQKQQLKQKQTDEISQQLQRNKLLYSLLNQANTQKDRTKQLYQEQKTINLKFNARIQDIAQLNNRLYQEKYHIHNALEEIKQSNHSLQEELIKNTNRIQQSALQMTALKDQVNSLTHQLSHQKSLKTQASQQLQIKTQLLLKANQTLQKLKEIKDRHERLQKLAQHDRDIAIEQKLSAMSKMQQQQHQLQAISDELQQCKQDSDIMVNKLNKTNELVKKRVSDLEEQLAKKEKAVMAHLNTIQVQRIAVMKREKQIQLLKERLQSKDSNIYKLQASKVYLQTNQPIVENKLLKKQQQLKKQAELFVQNLTKQSCLNSKIVQIQALLKVKTNQTHIQTQAYKKLTQYYKAMFIERGNYIHPMIYQDLLGILNKLSLKINSMIREIQAMADVKIQFQQKEQKLILQNRHLNSNVSTLSHKLNELTENNLNLQTQNDRLMKSIKQQITKLQTLIQSQKTLKNQLSQRTHQHQETQKLLHSSTLEVQQLKTNIQAKTQLIDEINKESSETKSKYQSQVRQNQQLKTKIDKLNLKLQQKSRKSPPPQPQKPPQQTLSTHTQTQQQTILKNLQQTPPKQVHQSQQIPSPQLKNIQTLTNNRQTTPFLRQRFTHQSKQLVQQLLSETQRQDYREQSLPMKEIPEIKTEEETKPNLNNLHVNNKHLSPQSKSDKKKIQKKKDFQRALKLTFMRR